MFIERWNSKTQQEIFEITHLRRGQTTGRCKHWYYGAVSLRETYTIIRIISKYNINKIYKILNVPNYGD